MKILDALSDFDAALEWVLDDDELLDAPVVEADALDGADAALGTI